MVLLIHSLRSGLRYRLSRREVVQLMDDVWGAEVALGSVVELEQAPSAALAPVVAAAHTLAQQAIVANPSASSGQALDETGWREGRRKAWLWVMVTALLTVFRVDRARSGQVARELLGFLTQANQAARLGTLPPSLIPAI